MVEFINKTYKNKMYVADDRVKEYLDAGHKMIGKTNQDYEQDVETDLTGEPVKKVGARKG